MKCFTSALILSFKLTSELCHNICKVSFIAAPDSRFLCWCLGVFQLFSRDRVLSVSGAYVRQTLWPGGVRFLLHCSGPLCLWGRRCEVWTCKSPVLCLFKVVHRSELGHVLEISLSPGCDSCAETISSGPQSNLDWYWLCECSRRSLPGV